MVCEGEVVRVGWWVVCEDEVVRVGWYVKMKW